VIDYGWPIAMTLSEVWLQASALTLLFLAALWAQVKRPRLAFPLLWFFLILAPTSSFIPVMTEIMAEHRFYLPSMMVILLGVLLVYRSGVQLKMTRRAGMAAGGAALALVCVLLIGETRAQNRLYHDIVVMWRHNVRHTPENRRAIFNLAFELVRLKEYDEARELLERAVEIDPLFPDSFRELSYVHYYQGDITAALSNVEKAMELRPEDPFYHSARGAYLSLLGRQEEGLASVEKALSLDPRLREGLQWRSNILLLLGRYDEARQRLSEMTGIPPGSPELDKQLMSTAQALGKPEIAEEIGRLSRDRDATR
jgi:tetratricopeptide (TPR) repeat protein